MKEIPVSFSNKPIPSKTKQGGCDEASLLAGLLTLEQARSKMLESITPISDIIEVATMDSFGYIIGEDILSPINVPNYKNSAMDGYAVKASDLPSGDLPTTESKPFKLVGTSWAGTPYSGVVNNNECIRIMTGAKVPDGTDTVIMQEHITKEDDNIVITTGHKAEQNVRCAGDDIKQGDIILTKGKLINAAEMGLIASLGFEKVKVLRQLKISFFSTGDELKGVGETLEDGQIFDSNRYTIFGMLQKLNVQINDMGVIPDDREKIEAAFLTAAEQSDVIITSGGVSVGDADYVKETLEKLGQINFWKLAMKPGKPLAYGKVGDAMFLGLPGNPVSVMATYYQLGLPAIQHLSGNQNYKPVIAKARATEHFYKRPGRLDFQRAVFSYDDNGDLVVKGVGMQASHILSGMSLANCFAVLPAASGTINPGETIEIQPFEGLI